MSLSWKRWTLMKKHIYRNNIRIIIHIRFGFKNVIWIYKYHILTHEKKQYKTTKRFKP